MSTNNIKVVFFLLKTKKLVNALVLSYPKDNLSLSEV